MTLIDLFLLHINSSSLLLCLCQFLSVLKLITISRMITSYAVTGAVGLILSLYAAYYKQQDLEQTLVELEPDQGLPKIDVYDFIIGKAKPDRRNYYFHSEITASSKVNFLEDSRSWYCRMPPSLTTF